jgi:hypothetical protein
VTACPYRQPQSKYKNFLIAGKPVERNRNAIKSGYEIMKIPLEGEGELIQFYVYLQRRADKHRMV